MKFINLADDSRQVPKLQRKTYADFKLTSGEWDNLDLLHNVLKVLETSHDLLHLLTVRMQHPAQAQQVFSSQRTPTVSRVFPVIEFLLTALEAAQKDPKFESIEFAIAAGVSNLEKWYRKLDACNVYAVCNGTSIYDHS